MAVCFYGIILNFSKCLSQGKPNAFFRFNFFFIAKSHGRGESWKKSEPKLQLSY